MLLGAVALWAMAPSGASNAGVTASAGVTGSGAALAASTRDAAGPVWAVLSREAAPFREAVAAMSESLESGNAPRVVLLDEVLESPQRQQELRDAGAIVAFGSSAAATLRRSLGASAPVAYAMVSDPEGAGLAGERPMPGVGTTVPISRQLEVIASVLPAARRIGVLHAAPDAAGNGVIARLKAAAGDRWEIVPHSVAAKVTASDIDTLLDGGVDIVWTHPDARLFDRAAVRALLTESMRRRIPVFGFSPQFVRAGALVGVGVDPKEQGRQAASIVGALLDGERPQPASPTSFVAINLIAARNLRVVVPAAVRETAGAVFGAEQADG